VFFVPGDVDSLRRSLAELVDQPVKLAEMSASCLNRARSLTHARMHWKRWKLLVETFPALTRLP